MVRNWRTLVGMKMGFSVLAFLTFAAFGSSVAVAWRVGSFTLPILLVLVAISLLIMLVSNRKEKQWMAKREAAMRTWERNSK